MKVKELIEELSKYSPDLELNFSCGIESGRSYDSCSDGDVDIEMDDDDIKLNINISGECTDYD